MRLTPSERLILYALGRFYLQLNQPLEEKPVKLQTSKIAFITFLLHSGIIFRTERTIYKNLESLEKKDLIAYHNRMVHFTEEGRKIFQTIDSEIEQYHQIKRFFETEKPKRNFQTTIR